MTFPKGNVSSSVVTHHSMEAARKARRASTNSLRWMIGPCGRLLDRLTLNGGGTQDVGLNVWPEMNSLVLGTKTCPPRTRLGSRHLTTLTRYLALQPPLPLYYGRTRDIHRKRTLLRCRPRHHWFLLHQPADVIQALPCRQRKQTIL